MMRRKGEGMKYLRNCWYVAMWAADLAPGEVVSRRILGVPLALYRRPDGAVAALTNACPHRHAPLSEGKVTARGTLQCPYHGLQFDETGQCVHNPHGAGVIPRAAKVSAYPLHEKDGIVWIWMGSEPADTGTVPDYPMLAAPGVPRSKQDWLRINAEYELIIENLLDLSHVSFLHDGILGNEETVAARIKVHHEGDTIAVDRVMSNVTAPGLFDLLYRRDGGKVDMWTNITWTAPATLVNDAGVVDVGKDKSEGTGIFGHHFLTPETEHTTLYHFCAVMQNPRLHASDPEVRRQLTELRRKAFDEQDRVIIDAQQAAILDPAVDTSRPVMLEVDAGPIRFRRHLERRIAEEAARREAPGQAVNQ